MAKRKEGIVLIINEVTINFKDGSTHSFEVKGHAKGWHTALDIASNGWNNIEDNKIASVIVKTVNRFVRKDN